MLPPVAQRLLIAEEKQRSWEELGSETEAFRSELLRHFERSLIWTDSHWVRIAPVAVGEFFERLDDFWTAKRDLHLIQLENLGEVMF